MKYFVYLVCGFHIIRAIFFIFNINNVLDDIKYSEKTAYIYAAGMLVAGVLGLYLSIYKDRHLQSLLVNIIPYVLMVLAVLLSVLFNKN